MEKTNEELLATVLRSPMNAERIVNMRLEEIVSSTREELGLTAAAFDRLQASIELGRRYNSQPYQVRESINSTMKAMEFCQKHFRRLIEDGVAEEFHVVFLDTKHRVKGSEMVTKGTLDASLVHPREIFAPAIARRCSAVLTAHNHPSGDGSPSKQDIAVCKRLDDAGKLIGIQHLDSIVLAREGCVSLRESS